MTRDFTLRAYQSLLESLLKSGYQFQTFRDYLRAPMPRVIILRHDIDIYTASTSAFASIEHHLGITASYYFRSVPQSFKPFIIKLISALGHEIGYHYEDLGMARGDFAKAIKAFEKNLAQLREFAPVDTICMHGSPLSRFDNRSIWDKYDYRNWGICGEPYFDVDYQKVLYLSDTGRGWNNTDASIRDKVLTGIKINIISTNDLITKITQHELPDVMIINTHPQRWNDSFLPWLQELVFQGAKNQVKKALNMIKQQ